MNKKIAIIDDEEDARIVIRAYLSSYCEGAFTIEEAESVESAIELLESKSFDLVFLDVQLTDGTGFDILNAFPDRLFQTIFTTGFDDYAIKAFKFSALDYLLKPIDVSDFRTALEKLENIVSVQDLNDRIKHLEKVSTQNEYQKMAIPTQDGTIYLDIMEISRVESSGNYSLIYTKSDQKYILCHLIKEYEELLPADKFYRTHKSHIVNLDQIVTINKTDSTLQLINGKVIPVARRRKQGLLTMIN